ncbi:2OG-Fe(II) oxygenase superfamily-domain-containing protein [Phlyctochytrium arcticum]|nr:2OG-Fe(II) oxygenase superfamily-domain-containing protein [Phlyctochytrium arcticum]
MGKKRPPAPLPPSDPRYANQTAFRIAERAWKRRQHPPELLATLISPADNAESAIRAGKLSSDATTNATHTGLPPLRVYTVPSVPGLILLPNLFTQQAERDLARVCLRDYACPPNVTNLDTHWVIPDEGLWNVYIRHRERLQDASAFGTGTDDFSNTSKETILIDPPTTNTYHLTPLTPRDALPRLRWASLGLQYNWSRKEYHPTRRPPIPSAIDNISAAIVACVQGLTQYPLERWRAEGGIVNFYGPRDALMAHQDRSEKNKDAPLVSFSLGNACVYLIGTTSRDDEPTAIKLQSGDGLVMHGACRLAYHAVPRILENTIPSHYAPDAEEEGDWTPFAEYMASNRININVRQVEN